MKTGHKTNELARLAAAMADGDVTEQDVRRLSALLDGNPEAQEAYLDCLDMHAMLRWAFRDQSSAAEPVSASPASASARGAARQGASGGGRRFMYAGLLAAGLAVAAVVAVAFWFSGADTSLPQPDGSTFARFTRSAGGHWQTADGPHVGDRLGPGRLNLESGIVQITYDSGVVALLAGPADFELTGPQHAYLHEGRVVLRVPPPAIGYTVETGEAKVIDLGTEFGVQATGLVGTDVQVYEGEVIAESKAAAAADQLASIHRLQGGQAMRLGSHPGDQPEELAFWPDRFVRYLPDPRDPKAPSDSSRRRVRPYNEARYDAMHIVPVPANLKIDGSLDDWDLSGRFTSHCEPPYQSFYHVNGAMMYDDEYLYIGAEVGDPFPMRSTVSPHVQRTLYGHGGCLAFRISTDRQMGWPVRGQGAGVTEKRALQPEDFNDKLVFLVLWYYAPEQMPCLHVKYGMDQHDRKVNPPGYRGAYRKRADGYGYTVEYAIPWSLLSASDDPPRPGDELGCTWLVHWAGPEGRQWKGQLIDVVNPGATGWNFQNAATWGRAIYHDRGHLPPGVVRPVNEQDRTDQ